MTIYSQNSKLEHLFDRSVDFVIFFQRQYMNNVVPRMGWVNSSHVNPTIWSSSYLILVTGELVIQHLAPVYSYFPQLLALGFLVGCTFAPNLKTFTGENIWGSAT